MPFNYRFILGFVALLWLLKLLEVALGLDFAVYGILPRTLVGLRGILCAPLIHGSFMHLISNTLPLLILGLALFWLYPAIASWVFYGCYLVTGALVWLMGRETYHIGASGLVYGIALFLMAIGFYRRDAKSIIVSIMVILAYGSIVWGVLPGVPGVSWESHLAGGFTGIGCASIWGRKRTISPPPNR